MSTEPDRRTNDVLPPAAPASVEPLEPRRLLSGSGGEPEGGPGDPNDQIAEADDRFAIGPDGVSTGTFSINPADDVDMFEFDLFRGVDYAFDIDVINGTNLDTYLRLFDLNGVEVAVDDDGNAPGEPSSRDSYLTYRPPVGTSGRYFLGVSSFPNTQYDPIGGTGDVDGSPPDDVGDYTLTVTFEQSDDPVDFGDQIVEATPIAVGASSGVRQIDPSEVDVYEFTAAAGEVIAFEVDHVGGNLNALLRLFDADGRLITSNDGSAQAPGEPASDEPFLERRFETAGTYYLGVSTSGNAQYDIVTGGGDQSASTFGSYVLRLASGDTNDGTGEAAQTTLGGEFFAGIDFAGDVDTYRFAAGAGTVASFFFGGAGSAPLDDGILRLRDAAGNVLVASDDSDEVPDAAPAADPFIEYRFDAGGTYFIEVDGFGNSTGPYRLRLPLGDANDSIADAAIYSASDMPDALIAYPGDVDLYAVTIDAAGTYGFDVDTAAVSGDLDSGLDSVLRLFDAAGSQIAVSDDDAAPGDASPFRESYIEIDLTAGTYYLGVSRFGNAAYDPVTGAGDNGVGSGAYDTGEYSLRVDVLDVAGPTVDFTSFGSLTAQQVIFGFDAPLDPASVSASDLVLVNRTTGQTIPSGRLTVGVETNDTILAFRYDIASFGPLPDGNYAATLPAGSVASAAGVPLAGDVGFDFFFLNGDFNRDRAVNLGDFTVLANNFGRAGRTFAQGDANYDGTVNLADFTILANRFGTTLPAPDGGGGSLFGDDDGPDQGD